MNTPELPATPADENWPFRCPKCRALVIRTEGNANAPGQLRTAQLISTPRQGFSPNEIHDEVLCSLLAHWNAMQARGWDHVTTHGIFKRANVPMEEGPVDGSFRSGTFTLHYGQYAPVWAIRLLQELSFGLNDTNLASISILHKKWSRAEKDRTKIAILEWANKSEEHRTAFFTLFAVDRAGALHAIGKLYYLHYGVKLPIYVGP